MGLQEDQSDRIVNHTVNVQTILLDRETRMIVVMQHQDLHFLIRMVPKYLHNQINIILNRKLFYQLNNNKATFMIMLLKITWEEDNNTVELPHKLQFKLANLLVEVLAQNSGDFSKPINI